MDLCFLSGRLGVKSSTESSSFDTESDSDFVFLEVSSANNDCDILFKLWLCPFSFELKFLRSNRSLEEFETDAGIRAGLAVALLNLFKGLLSDERNPPLFAFFFLFFISSSLEAFKELGVISKVDVGGTIDSGEGRL